MAQRSDIHRPSAIIPADYSYVTSYNLATTDNGWPIPPFNIDIVITLRQTKPFAKTGSLGQCSVCGAHFIYGDIWLHEPTGEHIYIGHDCADKYEMLADRSGYELQAERARATVIRKAIADRDAQARADFCAGYPGLADALQIDHPTIRDIADRFARYNNLSDKQIALVLKIAAETTKPAVEAEKHVTAPVGGRRSFRGVVVSTKSVDSAYGTQYKMVVKVQADGGCWLAWGTIPSALLESVECGDKGRIYSLRGREVEMTATLEAGKDAHFAFMKRPVGRLMQVVVIAA